MLQRMKDQGQINFLKDQSVPQPKTAEEKQTSKTISEVAEQQKSKKLENKDNGLMSSHHISSARTGVITDNGGPSKQAKMETSNTIFDPSKNSLPKDVDAKTKTKEAKDQIASNKRTSENNRMNNLAEALRETLQGKSADVSNIGTFSGSNYKTPKNNFSIFDSGDFERVEEKTAGEMVKEENMKRKSQKDDSWRNGGKSTSYKEVVSEFFDGLFKEEN